MVLQPSQLGVDAGPSPETLPIPHRPCARRLVNKSAQPAGVQYHGQVESQSKVERGKVEMIAALFHEILLLHFQIMSSLMLHFIRS